MRQIALEALRGDKPSAKKKAEEEAEAAAKKQAEEEEAAKKAAEEAEAKKKAEEEAEAARKKAEEEAAKKKAEEEAAAAAKKKKAEEEAVAAKKKAEEEAAAAKKKAEEAEAAKKVASTPSPKQGLSGLRPGASIDIKPSAGTSAPAPTSNSSSRRRVYTKEELLRYAFSLISLVVTSHIVSDFFVSLYYRLKSLPVCMKRPDNLPAFTITRGPSRSGGDRGGGDRGGDRRPRGDGGNWQRGAAPPPRRASTENRDKRGNAGGQWARGQAPPPKPQGRGTSGGRGGRGGRDGGSFYDGPVEPLVKSENAWRPKKNTSAVVAAEKAVKSILNKMTKEKFDRLSMQMCEIPISSHEILTMMIANVFEKAIDEPAFGDMYGDLCSRLSQLVQTTSFVQIIESDEGPPTDDGETSASPASGDSGSPSVYRWSNDVNTSDAEVVGPFDSVEECFDAALSESEAQHVDRGEMELELVKLQIKRGMFIKVMKKKSKEGEESQDEYYTVYFPVANHDECGQQLSKIFLSERECTSDANKANSFRRTLVNKCQDEFSKEDIYVDWKKEKAEYEETKATLTEAERAEKEEELEFRRIKIKKQMLGNIQFIGQLYKKNLIKVKIIYFCVSKLLKLSTSNDKTKNPVYVDTGDMDIDEEDHEALCSMFTTIGSTIDTGLSKSFVDVCFAKIKQLSTSPKLGSRPRFMYQDLLELRDSNWVPRRKTEKAKTIEEIRKDFEREEREKERQSQQLAGNYRSGGGSGRNDFSARNDRRGSDFRASGRQSNFAGANNSSRKPAKTTTETDDDGFTTIVSGGSNKRSSLARAATPQQAPVRQVQKVPTKQSFAALADDTNAQAPAETEMPEPLDKEKLERRVKTIGREFLEDPTNISDLLLSIDELRGTPDYGIKLVQINSDIVIDCSDAQRAAIYSMLAILFQKEKITSNDVKEGMVDFIEFIDSFVMDAPKAFDYLVQMMSTMISVNAIDIPWICEQAEKTKIASEKTPLLIFKSLVPALKTTLGDEVASSTLEGDSSAIEGLLGKDAWATLKSQL